MQQVTHQLQTKCPFRKTKQRNFLPFFIGKLFKWNLLCEWPVSPLWTDQKLKLKSFIKVSWKIQLSMFQTFIGSRLVLSKMYSTFLDKLPKICSPSKLEEVTAQVYEREGKKAKQFHIKIKTAQKMGKNSGAVFTHFYCKSIRISRFSIDAFTHQMGTLNGAFYLKLYTLHNRWWLQGLRLHRYVFFFVTIFSELYRKFSSIFIH